VTSVSKFYNIEPGNPDGVRVIAEFTGPRGMIRVGDLVVYENPDLRRNDGTYGTGGMNGPLRVDELVDLGDGPVLAVLNDGAWECSATNLRPATETGD
jgi:hypothetical protein